MWLRRTYLNLESVDIDCYKNFKELKQFSQMNPNVQTLSMTYACFMKNWKWLMGGKIAFDLFKLKFNYLQRFCHITNHNIIKRLQKLYARGVYKRLNKKNKIY